MSKPSATMVRMSLKLVNTMDMILTLVAFRDGYVYEGQ